MPTTVDFNSFRRERDEEPIKFIIGDKTYDLPGSIPASLAVDVIEMQSSMSADDDVPTEKLDSFGRALFGPTIWTSLLEEHRITVTELGPLLEMVMKAYTDDPKDPNPESLTAPDWTPLEVGSI